MSLHFLHFMLSEILPGQNFIGQSYYIRSKVKLRLHHDIVHPETPTNVFTTNQLPTPYSFQDRARAKFYRSKSQQQGHYLFIWGFTLLSTLQDISRRVVGWAEETSTYSWSRFCTVNCRPMGRNYQLFNLRPCRKPNTGLRGGRREC